MTSGASTFTPLLRRKPQRRIAALPLPAGHTGAKRLQRLAVLLRKAFGYGSLAPGDCAGFSDTDLLVVAANQDAGERVADQLMEALAGDPRPGDPPPSGAMIQAQPMAVVSTHHGHGGAGLGGAAGSGRGLRRIWLLTSVGSLQKRLPRRCQAAVVVNPLGG